jgi:hypothetical protein
VSPANLEKMKERAKGKASPERMKEKVRERASLEKSPLRKVVSLERVAPGKGSPAKRVKKRANPEKGEPVNETGRRNPVRNPLRKKGNPVRVGPVRGSPVKKGSPAEPLEKVERVSLKKGSPKREGSPVRNREAVLRVGKVREIRTGVEPLQGPRHHLKARKALESLLESPRTPQIKRERKRVRGRPGRPISMT